MNALRAAAAFVTRSPVRSVAAIALALFAAVATTQISGDQQALVRDAVAQAQDEGPRQAYCQSLYMEGRYDEARKVGEEGLALAEKAEGPEGLNVARWLNQLGLIYGALGDYPKAEVALKRALAIREKVLGPEHPDTVLSINNLAVLYDNMGRYAEAVELQKRALAINEKTLGPENPHVATNLNNLALIYMSQGRLTEAEPLLKRALAISEKVNGPEDVNTATSLLNLGVLYFHQSRFAEAEPLYKRALAIYEKVSGPYHPDVSTAINNLAELYRIQGRYAEAEPLFKRALAIDERSHGANSPDVALVLGNLGALYDDTGRYSEAESNLKRALAIYEAALGPEHPQVANALTNLASVYRSLGWLDEAEPLYLRALAIDEKTNGPNHTNTAISLGNLAGLYTQKGDYAKAEPLFARALAIFEKSLGPDNDLTALALNNMASITGFLKRYDAAIAFAKRAITIFERRLGPDHIATARAVGILASLYVLKRDLPEAERQFRRGIASLERSGAPSSLEIGGARYHLSAVLLDQGKAEEALENARVSIAILADRRARAIAGQLKGGGAERVGYADFFAQFVRAAYAVARLKPERESALLAESYEAAQLQTLDETEQAVVRMASRFATGNDALGQLLREQRDLLQRLPAVARLYARAVGAKDPGTRAQAQGFHDESARIGARLGEIDARLRADYPVYAELVEPKPVPLRETEALLDDREAVVSILPGLNESFSFAVSKSGARWAKAAPSAGAIAKTVSELRQQLEPGAWRQTYAPFDRKRAHQIYRDLWAPVAQTLEGKSQVFVVTTGPLASMPLGILVTEQPGAGNDADPASLRETPWLIKRHALVTLPAVSSLKALRRYANKTSGSEPFAGFGDPVLRPAQASLPTSPPSMLAEDGTPVDADVPGSGFPIFVVPRAVWSPANGVTSPTGMLASRLSSELSQASVAAITMAAASPSQTTNRSVASVFRGTDVDLRQLSLLPPLPATARELRSLAVALGASETRDVYLRERATEAQIKSLDLSRKRVIAFSTHGLTAGLLGLGESGLVFTLPSRASERDDGYLSASEAARLNLRADWIILSACNTAAGDSPGAKGLSGLARAFFLAGAKSLLVSHWRVWDDVAERLTTAAVRNSQANPALGRAEALRQSMLSVMKDESDARFAHPAAWAPFVLVGETGAN